jgi:hypothetical protein
MISKMVIRDINRILKTVVRRASPPVSACEGSSYTFTPLHLCNLFKTHGSLCKRYLLCFYQTLHLLSYCHYTCDLNILNTRIEASVPPSRIGVWHCDPSFVGTLTRVSSLEHDCECVLPLTARSLQKWPTLLFCEDVYVVYVIFSRPMCRYVRDIYCVFIKHCIYYHIVTIRVI